MICLGGTVITSLSHQLLLIFSLLPLPIHLAYCTFCIYLFVQCLSVVSLSKAVVCSHYHLFLEPSMC